MYTPLNNTFASSLATVATVDVSLHSALGISWRILLPYTVFGAVLMIYSQSRLFKGQFELARATKKAVNEEVANIKDTKVLKSSSIKSVNYPISYN